MTWRGVVSDTLERGLFHPLRILPSATGSAVGDWLGRRVLPGLYPVGTARARAAIRHLRPDLDAEAALAEAWANIAASFAEMPRLLRLWDEGRIAVEGEAPIREALAAGRPVICAWLHTGNPEVLGLTLGRLGLRPLGIAARQASGFRDRVVAANRRGYGGRVVLADQGAMRPVLAALRADPPEGTVMLAVDEHVGGAPRGPSLGRAALPARGNMAMAGRLARLTGAVVVPGYVTRLGGARFVTRFLPPVAFAGAGGRMEDAAAIDAAVDPVIRAMLPQWHHLVYVTPPEGDPPAPADPSAAGVG